MGNLINLKEKSETPPDNLITSGPWEFRRANWESKHFIQMLRSHSARLEMHRKEIYEKGDGRVRDLPAHFALSGGMAYTIQGIYAHRNCEEKMREVYYLAGLIDCMINQVSPLLRTDLIRDVYKNIITLRKALNINWYGHLNHVLFPIDAHLYNTLEYKEALSMAKTMKQLYGFIREGVDDMFDILSVEYAFYSPGQGA
jgi:hypothetical protein